MPAPARLAPREIGRGVCAAVIRFIAWISLGLMDKGRDKQAIALALRPLQIAFDTNIPYASLRACQVLGFSRSSVGIPKTSRTREQGQRQQDKSPMG